MKSYADQAETVYIAVFEWTGSRVFWINSGSVQQVLGRQVLHENITRIDV